MVDEAIGDDGLLQIPFETVLFCGLGIERPPQHGGDINGREVKSMFDNDDAAHSQPGGTPSPRYERLISFASCP